MSLKRNAHYFNEDSFVRGEMLKNDAFDMLDKATSVVSGIIKDELVYLACKEDIHLNDNYVTLITFA